MPQVAINFTILVPYQIPRSSYATDASIMQQVKLIEENWLSRDYFDNHNTIRQMISRGGFKNGTCIMPSSCTPAQTEQTAFDEVLVRCTGGEIEEDQSETVNDLSHACGFQ